MWSRPDSVCRRGHLVEGENAAEFQRGGKTYFACKECRRINARKNYTLDARRKHMDQWTRSEAYKKWLQRYKQSNKYKAKMQHDGARMVREMLPSYIGATLRIPARFLTKEVLEAKRLQLRLKRLAKERR